MDLTIFFAIFMQLFGIVAGGSCYYSYYLCSGSSWCCPDGYVCTGTSTCLSIGAIVGIVIGCLVGLGIFIAVVCTVCLKSKGQVGAVVTQPTGTVAYTTGQQQYGGQQHYGGQQIYGGQPQYGGQPFGGQQYGQPAYPPPPPPKYE